MGGGNVVSRNGFSIRCDQWDGAKCARPYIQIPQSALTQEASCGVEDFNRLRPMWYGDTTAQCQTFCWIATGDSTCVSVDTNGPAHTETGWMYTSSGEPRCDTSGRKYSRVSVPTVGQQLWSFDSTSWSRTGTFSRYQCNW